MAHLLQQQPSLFSQASWGRLEMKPERNKFKKKMAHLLHTKKCNLMSNIATQKGTWFLFNRYRKQHRKRKKLAQDGFKQTI